MLFSLARQQVFRGSSLMKAKTGRALQQLRMELESIYGPRLTGVILFGSQARGDAAPASDIDVLVVLDGDVEPGKEIARTGSVVAALSLKFNLVISCIFISAERYSNEQTPLLLNIRNEGVAF
jgi:predicted nucleotidyltransferase